MARDDFLLEMDTPQPGTRDATSLTTRGRYWSGVRIPHVLPIACVIAAATVPALLYLTRRLDFFYDEWDFLLGAPTWTLRDYFLPHNEHWSTIPALIYKLILTSYGARSYVPFMAVLFLMHAGAALLLFLLVRRRSGDLPALATILLLLFVGRGYENLYWAFQIGFVGSAVFGLMAMYLLDEPDASPAAVALAAVALLLSVMSSGEGLIFGGALAADLLLDRQRRTLMVALLPAVLAYAGWYLAFGRSTIGVSVLSIDPLRLVTYVPFGVSSAAAGVFAQSSDWSQVMLFGLGGVAGLLAMRWVDEGHVDTHVLGAVAGLVGQFVLTGLVRSQMGDAYAARPRYVYMGSIFVLLILTAAARYLPWRGGIRFALPAVLVAAVAWNAVVLREAVGHQADLLATQAVELDTVWALRHAPDLDARAIVDPVLMPNVRVDRYLAARRLYGSPLRDMSRAGLDSLPPDAVNLEVSRILPLRPQWLGSQPAGMETGRCRTLFTGDDTASLSEPGGSVILVRPQSPGRVAIQAWLVGADSRLDVPPPVKLNLDGGQAVGVRLPDAGNREPWQIRVTAFDGGPLVVCSTSR